MQIGTWCMIPSPEVINVLSINLDFVILDMEHGNIDYSNLHNMINAAKVNEKFVWARPRSNNEADILHLLDSGVDGIIIPHVSTKEDADKLKEYSLYPPHGNMGYSPFTAKYAYGRNIHYMYEINQTQRKAIIIEDMVGFSNLDYFLDCDFINMIYIGIYDLSSSLGVALDDPKIIDIFTTIAKMTHAKNKEVGAIFSNEQTYRFLLDNDVEWGVYKTDTAIIHDATILRW